ncbi:MAG: TonB-dependent receptor [Bacteroidota bacterium]
MIRLIGTVLLISAVFLSQITFAQKPTSQYSITGQVIDNATGQPLEYTSVSVYTNIDSALVGGGVTDAKGQFNIGIKPGNYYLKVQFISYKEKLISDVIINQSKRRLALGSILLEPDAETLSEVTIEGDRDQLELKLDKRVFNVAEDASNAGRNAVDILDNVPSVAVDQDGNVSLRGSENVRILVDGKPSGLIGISSSDGLRQLQGDLIESIEVVTNPSARYDAEGNAGIINIILKKDRKAGLNGGVTVNTGYPNNHGASLNFNYRKDKINFFASYGIGYRRNPGRGSSFQRFFETDSSYVSDQATDFERGGLSNNVRTGLEFFLNDHNTITGSFLYRVSDDRNDRLTSFRDFDGNNTLIESSLRDEDEEEDDINFEYNLNYRRTFKNKDQLLTADLQYRDNTETELADIVERNLFNSSGESITDELQFSDNQESEESWLAQVDYVHPFGQNARFETGYRGNFRRLANDFVVSTSVDDALVVDTNLSNNFRYNEYVNAVYAIYGNEIGKISYQLGLRVEATDIEIGLLQTEETFDKQYTDAFPSAFFTYKLGEGNSLQTSYSRRIRRPRSRNLNPFPFSIGNNRNLRTGNPDLDPTYTDSYEIGYLRTWKNSSLFASFYYRQTDGVVQRITTSLDTVNISAPVNLSREDAYGFELNYSYDITDWWKVDGSANLYRQVITGGFEDQNFDSEANTLNTRLNSRMTIKKKVDLQLNWRYRAPQQRPQREIKSFTTLDIGASMDVMNGKGTLVANVRDVFNSGVFRSETTGEFAEGGNFVFDGEFQWRVRAYTLNFSYRINQKKNQRDRNRRRGGGDQGFDDDF